MRQYKIGDRVHDQYYAKSVGNGTIIAMHPNRNPTGTIYYSYEVEYDEPILVPSPTYPPLSRVIRCAEMLEPL